MSLRSSQVQGHRVIKMVKKSRAITGRTVRCRWKFQ